MSNIKDIINEEIMTTVANYPEFGQRLHNLNEIGEANHQPYDFKYENTSFNEVHYYFSTEMYDYDVPIINNDVRAGTWELQFGPIGGTTDEVTNEGKQFEILSTIIKIIYDFVDKHKPNVLSFKPSKDKNRVDDKRRFNFYMAYIKKHNKPEYLVREYGDYIIIERKIKIKSNVPKV
ncbi:MAG: hypothetical protein PF487_08305 [Bacteroidales bacterium]|jgi:hypothetical protein|nr:hypothetical protein [Bacteroidales bacterium]